MRVQGKVIVVTGAGSGIGREVALGLLQRGARVAAVDLNPESLAETLRIAGNSKALTIHCLSVADRAAVQALPAQVIAAHGHVDGIANVAGIIQPFVRINDLDYNAIERVMNVNFWGVVHTVKSFLPELLKRPQAHILNVSSMGAYAPVPGQVMYGASKAAVKLLTEGLYAELLETNIGVTAVFPGATATNIAANSGITMDSTSADSSKFKSLPASTAASLIIDGIEKNRYHVFTGSDAKMMDRIARYAPNRVAKIIYKQMKSLLG